MTTFSGTVKATDGRKIELVNIPEWVVMYGRYCQLHPTDAKNLRDWAEETGRYELAEKVSK